MDKLLLLYSFICNSNYNASPIAYFENKSPSQLDRLGCNQSFRFSIHSQHSFKKWASYFLIVGIPHFKTTQILPHIGDYDSTLNFNYNFILRHQLGLAL